MYLRPGVALSFVASVFTSLFSPNIQAKDVSWSEFEEALLSEAQEFADKRKKFGTKQSVRTPSLKYIDDNRTVQFEIPASEPSAESLEQHVSRRKNLSVSSSGSQDVWRLGEGDFEVALSYQANPDDSLLGTFAKGGIQLKVLGVENDFFSWQGQASSVSTEGEPDGKEFLLKAKLMGKTISIVRKKLKEPAAFELGQMTLFNQNFFFAQQIYMLGPIPLTGSAGVAGRLGFDQASVSWVQGTAESDGQLLKVDTLPAASLNATGTGGVGIPNMMLGLGGSVDLVHGNIESGAVFDSRKKAEGSPSGNCVHAGLKNIRVLDGVIYAFLQYRDPAVYAAELGISGICGILGSVFDVGSSCDAVKETVKSLSGYFNFALYKELHSWEGMEMVGEHSWYNSCPVAE